MDKPNQNYSTKTLRIMHWNMRTFRTTSKRELSEILFENKIDVALICETRLKYKLPARVPGYNIVRKDRDRNGGGGVAILIGNEIMFREKEIQDWYEDNHIETVAVEITFGKKKVIFAEIYVPPDTIIQRESFIETIKIDEGQSIFIGGDFNSHHALWGSTRNDGRRAEALLEFIDQHGLIVLNTGEATRITRPGQRKSCIDLMIASPELALIADWRVLSDTYGSDHYPIVSTQLSLPSRKKSRDGMFQSRKSHTE